MSVTRLAFEKTLCAGEKSLGKLVLVHGMNSHKGVFQPFVRHFNKLTDVYSLDLRNHGDSEWKDTNSYDEMTDDILFTLDDLEVEKATFIGHSLGGKICMNLTAKHPDRVQGLGLIDIGPFDYWDFNKFSITANSYLGLQALTGLKLAGKGLPEIREQLLAITKDEAKTNFILTAIEPNPLNTLNYRWMTNLRVLRDTYLLNSHWTIEGTPQFQGPVLAMIGERSEYIDFRDLQRFRNYYPNVDFETFKGDHFFFLEEREAFIKSVQKFLEKVYSPSESQPQTTTETSN